MFEALASFLHCFPPTLMSQGISRGTTGIQRCLRGSKSRISMSISCWAQWHNHSSRLHRQEQPEQLAMLVQRFRLKQQLQRVLNEERRRQRVILSAIAHQLLAPWASRVACPFSWRIFIGNQPQWWICSIVHNCLGRGRSGSACHKVCWLGKALEIPLKWFERVWFGDLGRRFESVRNDVGHMIYIYIYIYYLYSDIYII